MYMFKSFNKFLNCQHIIADVHRLWLNIKSSFYFPIFILCCAVCTLVSVILDDEFGTWAMWCPAIKGYIC
ncbi:hypothetical protein EB796_013599 [Bugula neritina]|uniref:Uncharacterized protein n=1 Tax=Bugula neritina TaxID=10212 RepID=A0A7J7JRM8_BUGNE|nr:hypothetical protein EB796_013599 [Bugula neritina]